MANFIPRGTTRKPMREVRDTRKPLYITFILDTSASMNECMTVEMAEGGGAHEVKKIEELNLGLEAALNSLRRFEKNNVLYRVYYMIIELNSYGKALIPEFTPLSGNAKQIEFEAGGVTCLDNSLSTLKGFLDPKYMPGCNRAVNVILMSDGYPTDVEGYVQSAEVYERTIDEFKEFLEDRGLKPNVDLYSIGVGEDACGDMLKYFADEGNFYEVEALESLADKLDFVTRKSLVRISTRGMNPPEDIKPESHGDTDTEEGSAVSESITLREIDVSRCLGGACLACIDSCAISAIRYDNGIVVIDPGLCVGCGGCDDKCPVNAIQLRSDDDCDGLV